jgi:tetratricopeptide (TPR) repeat protein
MTLITRAAMLAMLILAPASAAVAQPADDPVPAADDQSPDEPTTDEPAPEESAAEEPAADEPAAADGGALLAEAYEKTKAAATLEDVEAIFDLTEQAQAATLTEDQATYARKLLSWAHNRRGELRAEAGQADEALADFEQAVTLDPERAQAVYNRGVSYAAAGKFDEALADLEKAIELRPQFAKAHLNRGEVLFSLGQLEEALAAYDRAIRYDDTLSAAYNARGFLRYLGRDYDAAVRDFTRAIELDGQYTEAVVNRGDAQADRGRYTEAAQDYRRAIEIDDHFARAYLSWAWMMATCPREEFRNAERALDYAQFANRSLGDKRHHRYLAVLAAAQANAGSFDEAIETQQQAIEAAPADEQEVLAGMLAQYEQRQPYRSRSE